MQSQDIPEHIRNGVTKWRNNWPSGQCDVNELRPGVCLVRVTSIGENGKTSETVAKSFFCARCHRPHPVTFMLVNEVWNKLMPNGGALCLECAGSYALEVLGRPLALDDFTDCQANSTIRWAAKNLKTIMNTLQFDTETTPENRIVRRYRDALEQIAALSNATEVRGPLEDIGVPGHMVKEGGWVPIPPSLKDGLRYAAKIAKAALDDSPNALDGQPCHDSPNKRH